MWEYLFRQIIQIKYKTLSEESVCLAKYRFNISSLNDLVILWKFIINEPSADLFLRFLLKRNWLDFNSVLEIALELGHTKFIQEIQKIYSLDVFFGSPRYHFNEVVVLKSLKYLKSGTGFEIWSEIMDKVDTFSIHTSREVTIKIIEAFNYVFLNEPRYDSNYLQNAKQVFDFFKHKKIITQSDEFFIFRQIIKTKNIAAMKIWSEYLNQDSVWLFLETGSFDFLMIIYHDYAHLFKKRNYILSIVKAYTQERDKLVGDFVNTLTFLVDKNLIEVKEDLALLKWIAPSMMEAKDRLLAINALVKFGFLPPNGLILNSQVNPESLVMILGKGKSIKELAQSVLGAKSPKAQNKIKRLIENIQDKEVQNEIVYSEFAISQLGLARDQALKKIFAHLIELPLEAINQLKYIALQFPISERLKILKGITKQHQSIIKETFELISFIQAESEVEGALPVKVDSLKDLLEKLLQFKSSIQKQNVSFNLAMFAEELESKRFQEFKIKVPKNALELMSLGLDFNNCLKESHHAKYVTDIIHRKLIVVSISSIHSMKTKYCISIDVDNEKIREAKSEGQIAMPEELRFCFDLFLRDLDYGKKWL